MIGAEIPIVFAPKGDDEVLEAIKKVTRHVGDLKRIAKTPIDLQVARNALRPDDFNRLKDTIDRAKEATRDFGKEAERAAKASERASLASERATARKLAAEEKARVRMIQAAERATAKEEALAARSAARYEREAARKAVAAEKAANRAAAAAEKAAAREARANPTMGGFTGSMMGGGGGRGGGGGSAPMPLGGGPNYGPVDVKAFSTKSVDALNKSLGLTADKAKSAGFQLGFVARIVAAMGVRAAVREVFQLADAYTTLQNKLRTTVGADSLGFISKEIFKIAQESRTSLESVTTAFSRTTRSVKSLGKSQQEVLTFTGALSKAIQIGGSTSMEASNAMIQLSQGMGSGALRGDELRSVLEQLPIVAELIADKMGVPISALRKLGAAGAITTEVIFEAISGKSEELTEKMKSMQLTVGQAWTMMKNQATMSSAAMQGVMNALANTIQFITNHFEAFATAALMIGAALGAGGVIKLIMAAVEAFTALKLVMLGHPILFAAGAIAVVTAALVPLIAQLRVTSDSTVTWGDVWSATWDEIKSDLTGREVIDGIKAVDGAMIGLSDSTKEWAMWAARGLEDILASKGINLNGMITGQTKDILNRVDRDAHFKETERMINEGKDILAEDISYDGGISEEDRIMKELDAEREGLLAYAKILEDKERKEGGKNPSGQTFAELMESLGKERDKAYLTSDSNAPTIEERVAQGWIDAVDKLEDKIGNNLTDAQAKLIAQTIEERIILEDMVKLREKIQKTLEEQAKAERKALEEYSEKYKKFVKEREELEKKNRATRSEVAVAKAGKMQGIASSLSPNVEVAQRIAELQKFQDFARQNNLAEWASRANDEIQSLQRTMLFGMDPLREYADQMKSIFGPGGVLVKGFADAAANAIVMSQSLGELKRALVDVLNNVQKQALSALIQVPLNIAMGALTNSLAGGAGPSSLGGGARSVGAAEAKSWGFASGGYTGNMGVNEPAGIVHGQEFVLNADATRRMGKQNLDMINKGATPVSASQAPMQVILNNNAGVIVETNQLSPTQVEVMINKAIRDQTGRVVAGAINDPNSTVSRSLQKNLDNGRRRV
jgi:tape measure domain-containing protein